VFLIILNYFIKGLTILLGLVFLTGLFLPDNMSTEPMLKVMGVILIVWGIYRIFIYRSQLKRYKRYEKE